MRISAGGESGLDLTARLSTIPNGRLFVPASYWITTGAQTTTIDSTADSITYSWFQHCDMELSAISVHIASVSVEGNLNLSLCANNSGVPGTEISAVGVVGSGAAAGWIRRAVTPAVQLSRGTRYHLVVTGTAAKSYTISSRRNNTATGTGYSGDAKSYTKLDGAGSWTALTQDGLDANFLVVLNSTAANTPSLHYGQFNGANIPIPGAGLLAIPSAGLSIDTTALTVSTLYYVYAYSNAGTLAIEASATVPVLSAGLWTKTGATGYLLLGCFYTVAGPGSAVSPIDCEDFRGVANVYNKIARTIGKRQIYTGATNHSVTTSWIPWNNNTDWKVSLVSWDSYIDIVANCMGVPASGQDMVLSVGLDATDAGAKQTTIGVAHSAAYNPMGCNLTMYLENGLHYVNPVIFSSAAGGAIYLYYVANISAFRGLIWS